MAFEGISMEVSEYWATTLKEVDNAHENYLQAGPQERLLVEPTVVYPRKWSIIENKLRGMVLGLLPASVKEQITAEAVMGRPMAPAHGPQS